jgi:DNA mismatch repair protein MutS
MDEINSKVNIVEEYFRLHKKYADKYGKDNTILFLQVGSFFEAYQTLEDGFNLQNISDILNILVSKKNKSIIEVSIKNPYMLGFPIITLDKFLKILIDNGFNIVIGEQITPPPNPKRAITHVYSPGTYIENTQPDSNNILSIYIEEIKSNLIIGLSIIDLSTGKSIIHEMYSSNDDEKICLDNTIRFMYGNQAKEIILTSNNLNETKLKSIIAYLEISDKFYHHQTITQLINNGRKSLFKLSYQQEVLRKVYPDIGLLTPIEYLDLENINFGRLSFIILLNYAYDHSHNIINNIAKPELYTESKYLNLGNNAIFQLNLLTTNQNEKSLFDIINKTSTPMGRRMLKYSIAQPLINHKTILDRYNFIKLIMINNKWEDIEKRLIGINDIERLNRKINLLIINPNDLYIWIQSMSNSIELFNYIYINQLSIENINVRDLLIRLNEMLGFISGNLLIEELQKYLINDISNQIFCKNMHPDIELLVNKINRCKNYMDAISWGLSDFLDNYIQSKSNIKIEYNEREGHFLILTKRRAEVLIQLLEKNKIIVFNYNNIEYKIVKDDLQFKHLPKGNNSKIFIKEMEKNSSYIIEYEEELKLLQKEYYIKFLSKLSSMYNLFIESISMFIATIDYLKSGAKIAIKNHYIIPELITNKKSFLNAIELRHPIIELLNVDKEYIPIDIELGTDKQDGILLFGLNSAGKSSLQKSIGISIIMAQMGYPVAATKFSFSPYENLYTRISSNDNIYKGLSSFALEISELRAILKRSNSNTLVIADEVCKGTEHKSSLIIVQTMLEILSNKKTSFITATHLHDITKIERLHKISNIKMYHLHVEYNENTNTIIYDRKLTEGSGDNFYGLNVAKYLIADNVFMKLANEIKKEVFEIADIVPDKLSNYNNNLYMDKCHICQKQPKKSEIPLETHHIIFQKDFINGINMNRFHIQKNHKSNLVVLCSNCHDMIDNGKINIIGWINSNKYDKLEFKYL